MITPRFELNQTTTLVTITIHAPYASVKDAEVYVDGTDFRFASSPYYLRLTFPDELLEVGASDYMYDADNGTFIISMEKVNKGRHFENLDLISTLLVPPGKVFSRKPHITVLNGQGEDDSYSYTECAAVDHRTEPDDSCVVVKPKYGFSRHSSQVFIGFEWEAKEMLDLEHPDDIPECDRRKLREDAEMAQFSDEHYLADRADRDNIDSLLKFVPVWHQHILNGTEVTLQHEDVQKLKQIKVREYLLTAREKNVLLLGLVDILGAYCYDHRTTEGDPTSESGWTINKLSSTLSWFDEFQTVRDVLVALMRRSLCYPLYRSWDLSVAVVKDLQQLLKLGKQMALKCLLEIHNVFNNCPPRYILNRLYIEDYCIWIQSVNSDNLFLLADKIDENMPSKEDLGLDIVELEMAADVVVEEERHAEMLKSFDEMALNADQTSSLEETASSSSEDEDSDEDDSEDEHQSEVLDSDDLSS
ncbi:protein SHQ1 homolog isoform X2 [Periplaneta americana]